MKIIRWHLLFLITLLTWLPGSISFGAIEQPISLEADFIEYRETDGVVTASGNARVTYKETVFTSDELEYDTVRGVVKTALPFKIIRDHEEFSGVGIEYALEENVGRVGNTLSLAGKAHLVSKETQWAGDRYIALDAVFSTCERPDEEYTIKARRAVYFPGRKRNNLELTDASLYLYGTRIITLPSLTLTVGGRNKRLLPVSQYSLQRGWSVSYAFDYMDDEKNSGTAVLEYYSNLGFGGGLFHTYHLSEAESLDGVIRYLPDTGMQGGGSYHHLYPGGELQVALMRTDILNSSSLVDYYTFYLITQLPEITWTGTTQQLGDSGFSFGYQLAYGSISENLLSSAGPSLTQVSRTRARGVANLAYKTLSLSPSTRLDTSLSETYNAYNGAQEFQSVAAARATITQDLWKSSRIQGGYLHLMQGGLSPFSFDRRDTSNNFLFASFETPLVGDLRTGLNYYRDLDRNSDTLLDYTLKYVTDCFYIAFSYGVVSKGWSIDFKLLGID